jgi:lysozyme family protein
MTLVTIQGSMVAEANTVAAFRLVDAHYGGRLTITSPYGANRTTAQQQYLRNLYLAGKGSYAAPAGQSNHQGGRALDISNWASFPDLQTVMARYGFKRDPSERWHYNYTGATSTAGGGGTVLAIIGTKLADNYVRELQRQLGVTIDGVAGAGTAKALQAKIGTTADGDFGKNSIIALQKFVGTGADGVWGDGTSAAVRAAIDARRFGSPAADPGTGNLTGTALEAATYIKSQLGADYVAKLQSQLGVGADGIIGRGTINALQTRIGASPVDGDFGKGSVTKLQSFLGIGADGVWGNGTTATVKAAIDAGKFGATPPPAPTTPSTGTPGDTVTAQELKDFLGAEYVKKLQGQLGITADGIVGEQTFKALQAKIGTVADGAFGNSSNKALQTFLGIGADGLWGAGTTAALKAAIDASKFGAATTTPPVVTPPVIVTPPATGTVLDPTAPWKTKTPDSGLAKWVGSPNYDRYPSNPVKDHITLHWMVGTLKSTDSTFQNPGSIYAGKGTNAATNYGVGLTEIHQYIKEESYQHGDGNRQSNTTGVSIEHEGGYLLPDGVTRKTPEKATLDLSAKLVADIANRNHLGKLVLGVNVFPHSHWTATACPGTLDMAYIVDEANKINGTGDSTPVEPELPEEPVEPEEPEIPVEPDVPTYNPNLLVAELQAIQIKIADLIDKIQGQ